MSTDNTQPAPADEVTQVEDDNAETLAGEPAAFDPDTDPDADAGSGADDSGDPSGDAQ